MHGLRTRAIASWLCLLSYVLAGIGGASGLVLCFGPDGHVGVEAAVAGDCGGCLPGGDDEPPIERAEDCPCSDVALPDSAASIVRAFERALLDGPPSALPPFADVVASRGFVESSRSMRPAAPRSRAPQRRPFVLLV